MAVTGANRKGDLLIVVMGATGKTGGVVADQLLAKKDKVRVIGRSAERLQRFTSRGAEAAVGDVTDAKFLTSAFSGAKAVYALIPPNYQSSDPIGHYRISGQAIASAVKGAGVSQVVLLSSLGAELPSGTGPIAGLHLVEEQLKAIPGINLLILRPGYFFENHFGSLGFIKSQGVNGGALKPDVPFSQIATEDIGTVAANALHTGNVKGVVVRELLGQRDVSPAEATRILGSKIGKPDLKYVQVPDEGFRGALLQAGFSKALADLFVEMSHALSEGKVRSLEGRNAKNTTPTKLESFADAFAQAYRAG